MINDPDTYMASTQNKIAENQHFHQQGDIFLPRLIHTTAILGLH